MTVLEQVQQYADTAHGGQRRKYTPDRYIVHPVRVMELCSRYTSSLPVLAAALLHDVLEDTPVTANELKGFLLSVMDEKQSSETQLLVMELTDEYIKSRYPALNRKKRKSKEAERLRAISPDAQTIKYADIIDNCREIVSHDPPFAAIYLRECQFLLQQLRKGNDELHRLADETINKELLALNGMKVYH